MPTTAGTGAEVTRFSVLYRNKDKESVSDYSIIPNFQIFDYTTLKSLPYEQKVVTSLDAFCHSVEAFWSVDATNESRKYSKKALSLFNDNFARYIENDDSTFEPMLECSMLAGKAINLARTTAPHEHHIIADLNTEFGSTLHNKLLISSHLEHITRAEQYFESRGCTVEFHTEKRLCTFVFSPACS